MAELYIHIPFCRQKCGYCVFYSQTNGKYINQYLDKMERDLANFSPKEDINSIYFGGGTPTFLEIPELKRLFNALKNLPLAPNIEISMEANPETLNALKLEFIRNFVNRLSIGVQSFDSNAREILGRQCSDIALKSAIEITQKLNFDHLNYDLIYAFNNQTQAQWQRDLDSAISASADHISCYSLTLEEESRLHKEGITTVDEDFSAEMWQFTGEYLSRYGINRYEVSNYAKSGCECKHNQNVWQGGKLYGFGPSAASYDGNVRKIEVSDIELWLNGTSAEIDFLPPNERLREIFVVQLRTTKGWCKDSFLELDNATDTEWQNILLETKSLAQKMPNLIDYNHNYIRLSATGLLFWDAIATELLWS